MTLTIIVCHMRERRQLLSRCLWYLENQTVSDFDVLVMHANKPKGDKLNRAFREAKTSHVMVVDDDDWVSPVLVESVIDFTTDFVGYDSVLMADGRYAQTYHQETASHICPIRTDLARQVPFGNDYLDDITWTRQVAPLVETEAYVDRTLYFYDKWNPRGGGWSPPRQVGWWPYDMRNFQWG